jgi:hypothetical protein
MTKDRLFLWSNLLLVFFVLITAAALYFFLLKGKTAPNYFEALEILDTVSGKVYGSRPIDDGAEFAIEFIHSVNQSPVRETFKVEGGQIQPVSVRFYSFGAGMQSDLEEGQIMSKDGDAMIITGFNRNFAELNYTVGTVSDHLLIVNGETVSLRDLCGKNAHIRIRIK